MSTILITGANRNIGLELTRQYAAAGWLVIASCRDPEGSKDLTSLPGNIAVERLDVTDPVTIARIADKYRTTPIDLLFLNAAINHQRGASLKDTDVERWPSYFDINVIGPYRVAVAFADNVSASGRKTIVAMGSLAGSFTSKQKGGYLYRSSKAALHNVVKALAADLADKGIVAIVMHPGIVRGPRAPESPLTAEKSVAGIRNVVEGLSTKDTGRFFSYEGEELSW